MSANSENVVFKKTFKIEKGVSLDRIYPNLTRELRNNDMTVELQSQLLPKYQALIKDTESKRVIGEFPMFGVYFYTNPSDRYNNKSLKVVYPYHPPLITSSACNSSTNCTLKLEVDSRTNYYDFLVSGNKFNRGDQKLTKSEILGLQNFDFVQYRQAQSNGHSYQIKVANYAIVESPRGDQAIQYSAELHDIDSKTTYSLPSKYCMFNAADHILACKTDKCEILSRGDYITLVKRQNGYEWYFSDQSGTRDNSINVTFSLDEINIDRSLLKQMELEYRLNELENESSSEQEIEITDADARIVAEKLLERDGKLKHVIYNAQSGGRKLPELLEQELMKDPNFRDKIMDTVRRSLATLSTEVAKEDALQTRVKALLNRDSEFKNDVTGPVGPQGPVGSAGRDGSAGATAREVAETLVGSKASDLGRAVLNATDSSRKKLSDHLATNSDLQQEVANKLTADPGNAKGPKGDMGDQGRPGTPGAAGIRGEQGSKGQDGSQGKQGPAGPQGNDGKDADPSEIAHRLAHSSRFKRSLKGEDGRPGHEGEKGDQGPPGREGFPGLDGKDGRDADPAEVAEKLVTTKADKLGAAVLDSIGSGGNLATQVANKVNLNQRDLVNKVDVIKLTEGVVNKLTEAEAKQITDATVKAITSDATKRNNPDPNAFKKYEKFAEKLAELLLQKSAINQSGANKLVEDKVSDWALAKYLLIHGGLSKKDKAFLLAEEKVSREKLAEYLLEYAGLQSNQNEASATIDHLLSHFFNTRAGAVTAALRSNPGRARGPKGQQGERGDDGHEGPEGQRGERGEEGTPGVPGLQGPAGKDGVAGLPGEQGLAGQDADLSEIMNRLAHNSRLKRPLKGDDSLSEQALDSRLNRSAEFQQKLQLRVMQGESYDQDKNEANIELEMEGKSFVIATFLGIGYFFKGDNLYIRKHITGENILIPKNFHFLKVVEDGLDNYKLAFCNNLGNLFFDHKKYDPEYADLSEEHKLIDLKYIKNAANIDLSKYYYHTYTPLFAVKQGELEGQSLEDYRADVYEIAKDKKIGTLIDEFGFFEYGKFHHIDHHHGSDEHSEELDVRIQDHEGSFQVGGNTIYPITLYDGHLDLVDYLGYSVNL